MSEKTVVRTAGAPWSRERIVEIVLEAGRLAMDLRKDLRFEIKSDASLVTRADRDIEGFLSTEFDRPERGTFLIGEETVLQKGEDYLRRALQGTCYIVDPIDGTSPYAHGLPNWGISIGLLQDGKIADGAIFLPEYRVLVLSDGPLVLEATRPEGSREWAWRELRPPPVEKGSTGIIAITQDLAKRGRVNAKNPVEALGAAVVPLVGLLQGRVLAYVGNLRLWDIAGGLSLLHRLNFLVSRWKAESGNRLGLEVGPHNYHLDPGETFRWGVRGGILVCPPSEEGWIRAALEC